VSSRLAQFVLNGDAPAIRHFERAVTSGRHWYLALLEAIGLWDAAQEIHNGRLYCYLIGGEAFDWLLLAERLCQTMDGLLPDGEKAALLLKGEPPLELPADELKSLVGTRKYQQYLNFFYGVTVEEVLIQVVREEIRKERCAQGFHRAVDYDDEVYRRIYGQGKGALLKLFRKEMGCRQLRSIGLTELKEFTYWLFKYRLEHCDQARVASDTKKALNYLKAGCFQRRPVSAAGS
jgi:hypothetical protein